MVSRNQAHKIMREATGLEVSQSAVDLFMGFMRKEIEEFTKEIVKAKRLQDEMCEIQRMWKKKRIDGDVLVTAIQNILKKRIHLCKTKDVKMNTRM